MKPPSSLVYYAYDLKVPALIDDWQLLTRRHNAILLKVPKVKNINCSRSLYYRTVISRNIPSYIKQIDQKPKFKKGLKKSHVNPYIQNLTILKCLSLL